MRIFDFDCEKNEEYGFLGWAMVGRSWADPYLGRAVAHDVMEHLPDDDGDLSGEWQAFGAMLLIRGSTGFPEAVARDLVSDHWHLAGQRGYRHCPKTRALGGGVDAPVQRAAVEAKAGIIEHGLLDDQDPDEVEAVEDFCNNFIGWARIGYRRACRRYGGWASSAHDVFQQLEAVADASLERAEMLGMRLRVRFQPHRLLLGVELHEPTARGGWALSEVLV
jgi:hypothetical protein